MLLTGASLPPVTFVGGKGGVGKTTIAAALAIGSAETGDRTLLVSTDPAHSTGDVLDVPLADEPTAVAPGLDAMEIDPAAEADRYIAGVKERIREVASPRMLVEIEREVDVARASPGAEESALFDRFTRLIPMAGDDYDRVIFDTAPTGHTLRLLALPERMEAWTQGLVSRRRKLRSLGRMWRNVAGVAAGSDPAAGPARGEPDDPVLAVLEERQARFRLAREVVTDPRRGGFLFVLVPERLPILETVRAVGTLAHNGVAVLGAVVNRVLPPEADGPFMERRRERESSYLQWIDDELRRLPRWRVPLKEEDVVGLGALRGLAAQRVSARGRMKADRSAVRVVRRGSRRIAGPPGRGPPDRRIAGSQAAGRPSPGRRIAGPPDRVTGPPDGVKSPMYASGRRVSGFTAPLR